MPENKIHIKQVDGLQAQLNKSLTNVLNVGNTASQNILMGTYAIGFNTVTPSEIVHINSGNLRYSNGTEATGYILVSDSIGVASWTSSSSLGLGTVGGSGTDNRLVRWNGTSDIQDSGIIIDDSDNITGVGNMTVDGSVIVQGDVTINGTTSTIDTQNLLVEDPLILLASTQSGLPSLDSGLMINRGSSATQSFIWDESENEFAIISTNDSHETQGNVSILGYSNLRVGGFKLTDGTQANGYILTSDSNGVASWTSSSSVITLNLNDLSDVTTSTASSGDTLRYDGANWKHSSLLYNNGSFVGVNSTSQYASEGLRVEDGIVSGNNAETTYINPNQTANSIVSLSVGGDGAGGFGAIDLSGTSIRSDRGSGKAVLAVEDSPHRFAIANATTMSGTDGFNYTAGFQFYPASTASTNFEDRVNILQTRKNTIAHLMLQTLNSSSNVYFRAGSFTDNIMMYDGGTNRAGMFIPTSNGSGQPDALFHIDGDSRTVGSTTLDTFRVDVNDTNIAEAFVVSNTETIVNRNSASYSFLVNGQFQYNDGNQASGYVLASDANGIASWTASSNVVTGDGNLYDNDGTIATASRTVTLAGSTSSDELIFSNGTTDIFKMQGDGIVNINTIGTATASTVLAVDSNGDIVDGSSLAGADGNGIYDGSGTLSGNTVVTMHGTASTDTFAIQDSTNTTDIFKIQGDGVAYAPVMALGDEFTFDNTPLTVTEGLDYGIYSYLNATSTSGNISIRAKNRISGSAGSGQIYRAIFADADSGNSNSVSRSVEARSLSAGTNYGVYIRSASGVNNYGFVVQDQVFNGLGTSTPTADLQIISSGTQSSDSILNVRDNADTIDYFKVQGDGFVYVEDSIGIGTTASTEALAIQANVNLGSSPAFSLKNTTGDIQYQIDAFGDVQTTNRIRFNSSSITANDAGTLRSDAPNSMVYAGSALVRHRFRNNSSTNWVEIYPAGGTLTSKLTHVYEDSTPFEMSGTGTKKLILGGGAASDDFSIRDSSDTTNYFKVQGDGIVNINTIGTATASTLLAVDSNGDIVDGSSLVGGSGGVSKETDTSSYTGGVTASISHNLNTEDLLVQFYDQNQQMITPGSIIISGTGSVDVQFSQSLTNVKTVLIG